MNQQPNNRLAGQTAIISGSSSGIGKACAIAMGRDGANIVVNYYKDKEAAEEVAHEIESNEGEGGVMTAKADVSKEKQVEKMFERAIKKFGTVDILVANAGIQIDVEFHKMELKDWQRVIDVNLTGQFLCARSAIREFLNRGMRKDISCALGKIIHMSSVHEIIPWAGHVNYATSKGGLTMLMQSLAQAYGPKKIRVNSIAPGAVKTDINKDVWSTKKGRQGMLDLIPYGRIGEPSDIGSVATWLASDESDYISGTTIFVDGAMTCYPGFATGG